MTPRRPPPPAPPVQVAVPAAIVVPDGCERDLSKTFTLAADSRYVWIAKDDLDAGELTLTTFFDDFDAGAQTRRFSRDGGLPWLLGTALAPSRPQRPLPVQVALSRAVRTRNGFHGTTRSVLDAGCAFDLEIVECLGTGLTVEAETKRTPACEPVPDAGRTRYELLGRPDAELSSEREEGLRKN